MNKGKLNIPSSNKPKLNIPTGGNKPKINIPPPPTQAAGPQRVGIPAVNGKPPSVMIAVPAMEMVNAEFAQHLAMASANLVAHGIRINCAFNIGSVITIARRNLVDIFMKSDFDYIWWVDSDMKFPVDSALRLLSRDKPVEVVIIADDVFLTPTLQV